MALFSKSSLATVAVAASLVLASGAGGAVAGGMITGKQIKNNSVTTKDVKNGTLTLADIAAGMQAALTGAPGATGATGATGAAGAQGENGADGAAGTKGATGPAGPAGPHGADGATGADGADGMDGAPGAAGADGAAGPQGEAGAKGDTGATGAQGPAGVALASGRVKSSGGLDRVHTAPGLQVTASKVADKTGEYCIQVTGGSSPIDATTSSMVVGNEGAYSATSTIGDVMGHTEVYLEDHSDCPNGFLVINTVISAGDVQFSDAVGFTFMIN